jgi:hypothetical protein
MDFQQLFSLAQCSGYLACIVGVAAFLQKQDRRLKALLVCEYLLYIWHYTLLGAPTAALGSLVATVRTGLAIYTRSYWAVLIIIAVNIGLAATLAKDWVDCLPLIGSCTGTIALFLLRGIPMRCLMLFGTTLWLLNNVLRHSIGGTALELFIAVANLNTIWRLYCQGQGEFSGRRGDGAEGMEAAGSRQGPATAPGP